ncbi:ribosomal protein S18-alanine N-acetyltransferase [Frigoribacterium sp. 2-23]|uniref:ribosomal protein S18-alanine N-acetyltransferase n=1 Tax=Frigoribacterium sp. 2-23 TaxID=3415006 RepID=UPI003C6EC6BF
MSFVLRSARPDDLDGIMAIESSVFENDAWSASSMAHELDSRDGWYLVATRDDDDTVIVGYAGMLAANGSGDADIQTIAVAPEARRHGLGRVLMTQLLNEARRRRAREVFLEVRADNPTAQALYDSLGFERIAIRPRYYMPDGVDAHVMRLTMTEARMQPAVDLPHRIEETS